MALAREYQTETNDYFVRGGCGERVQMLNEDAFFRFLSETKTLLEEFFKLLEKHDLIERITAEDRDRYKVLNSYGYYVKIMESAF